MGESCAFVGNSDIYGLGIRLGIYLQWLTSLIANHHSHQEIRSNLETNSLFLLAIFIAAVVATFEGSLQSAEVVILLHVCFGSIFSVLSIWGHRARSTAQGTVRFPILGSALRLLLTTAISVYAMWYWFHGITALDKTGCPTYTFLLTKVYLNRAVVGFFRIQSLLVMIVYALFFLVETLLLPCFLCLAALKGMAVAGIVLYLSPSKMAASKRRLIPYFIQLWMYITTITFWSGVNDEDSGFDRPSLVNWITASLNILLFCIRSAFQFFCLMVFRRCPPMGFPPLLRVPLFAVRKNWSMILAARFRALLRLATSLPIKPRAQMPSINLINDYFFSRSKSCALLFYIVNATCLMWAIISIELTLAWNTITGVYTIGTTGQLIPFAIGVINFVALLHKISARECDIRCVDVMMVKID